MSSQELGTASLQNCCKDSKSPYVRSHMSNPTAWQLWGPETLELAKRTNRLMFVSIGYAACHWCHVMAHESFDDIRIAQLLNEHYIPIKIDREERPDVDKQYMDFLQATTGGGGWPLNVFVTPDLEPIYGGTYWPGPGSERLRPGSVSFEQILTRVAQMWQNDEAKVRENGKQIVSQLRTFAQEGTLGSSAANSPTDQVDPELDLLEESYQFHKKRFDGKYGGFGAAPKFPTPTHLRHLLQLGCYPPDVKDVVGESECRDARDMVVSTLRAMARGGIKDQVGHGFARYSVTRDWSLPHFEKMLYDNAQLLPLYLDAYLATGNSLFQETAHDIAQYLTSAPMLSSLGGINSSEDADSLATAIDTLKREGAYYVWTVDEFKEILIEEEAAVCARYWNVQRDGNIDRRHDAQGELVGQNTLCISLDIPDLAKEFKMDEQGITSILQKGRQKLLAYREKNRPRPALDDKIVVAWNGMAIGGLARAGIALKMPVYVSAAESAASCLRKHLFDEKTSTLRRVYREGPGEAPGFADDYAFFIAGLIDLYEATFDGEHLALADALQQTQNKLFWDNVKHGFYSTPADQPDILIRNKDAMDNAEPSVNGVSASNLFRLGSLFNDEQYEKMGKQTVAAFEVEMGSHPGLFSGMMAGVVATNLGMKGIMVVGDGEAAKAAVEKYHKNVTPNGTILKVGGGAKSDWLKERNELLKDIDESKSMLQLCEGGVCKLLDGEDIQQLFP